MVKGKKEENTVSEVVEMAVEEIKFPLNILRENCMKLFGVTSSTFAGAATNIPEDGEYTLTEIKNKINLWLTKEVK